MNIRRQLALALLFITALLAASLFSRTSARNPSGNLNRATQSASSTAPVIPEVRTWTLQGITYAYIKLVFPDSSFRITDWGQITNAGADFSADARTEQVPGPFISTVTTTANIYTLGTLPAGAYSFTFKIAGAALKTHQFVVTSGLPPANPIDDQREFVRWQYKDFLGREPDIPGWDFWTDNITKCNDPARRPVGQTVEQCIDKQRVATSGAFFISPEFQYTGYYIYRVSKGALGRAPFFSEFTVDQAVVGNGIVVNNALSAAVINQNKQNFANQFVQRAEFKALYDGLTNQQYVDKLFQTTGVVVSDTDKQTLVNGLEAQTETKAGVLFKVVDGINVISEGNQQFTTTYGKAFFDKEFNRAFVTMEYFGYLRRDPDTQGFNHWLAKLDFFGNYLDAEMVRSFIISPEYRSRFSGALFVYAGADQTVTLSATASLSGLVSNDGLTLGAVVSVGWTQISGPGTVTFSHPNASTTTASFSGAGVYTLRLTANSPGFSGSDEVVITVNAPAPTLTVNAGADQNIALPNTATFVGTVSGPGGPLRVSWSKVSGPGAVIFSDASALTTTAILNAEGVYVLRLAATDGQSSSNDDVAVTVNPDPRPLPPDASMVAPVLDSTVATTLDSATRFLYTGANPIQTGVAPGTINPVRVGVLRGQVRSKNGSTLAGVKVNILNHAELGQTFTRADGRFDIAVNGGGLLTINFEKLGLLPAQRQIDAAWQDYGILDDVTMIGYDDNVTTITLPATSIQVARGGVITDADGTRRATLLFPAGTQATMVLPGGATQALTTMHVRATEYTVGANGPDTMPGDLPATSAYTYAVEFSADEAVAASAKSVNFNQPVINYLENFLNFPVGIPVPCGFYDTETRTWIPDADGRVVKILSITNGLATLDITGSNTAATAAELSALGVTDAERQQLTQIYPAGQSLWRTPMSHFSRPDLNFPSRPEQPAPSPTPEKAKNKDEQPKDQDCLNGSIIRCESQTLGETIGITGTPFSLYYGTDRVRGRKATYTLQIPLSGADVSPVLQRIELRITVAGRVFKQTFPAAPNQTHTFTWDGLDAYGRTLQGQQQATIQVGYVYRRFYNIGNGFGNYGSSPIADLLAREEITLTQQQQLTVGGWNTLGEGLGAWTLDAHHVYDPVGRVLYTGTGNRRAVQNLNAIITTVAGVGAGFSGDGGPATLARLNQPWGVTTGPDGSIYICDTSNNRIRKVDPNGVITTIAGTGAAGFGGDGGPATQALLNAASRAQVGRDGNIYIDDRLNNRVRRIDPNGIISTFAGTGVLGFSGDGGPATQAMLARDPDPFPAPDGSVYISDIGNHRIRRVMPDGIIRTIAGTGVAGFAGDGGPATQARLNVPVDLAIAEDGTLYIADAFNNRIRRVGIDGIITTVAGGGTNTGDGIPGTQAALVFNAGFQGVDMTMGPDGALYFTERVFQRVRRLGTDGMLTIVAGNGTAGFSGDGGPATQAQINTPIGLGFGPDGALYIGDAFNHRVRRVAPPLPGFNNADIAIPSEDGSEVYQFNSQGKHLRTLDALTAGVLYEFTYDGAGRLAQVRDTEGNVTTIERDGSGNPIAIVAPFGQRTTLGTETNGYLNRIADPLGNAYQMAYTADGLLTTFTDPKGNASQMTYDALGFLTKDTNAAGGFTALARAGTSNSYAATLTSALNRVETKQVTNLATGVERRVLTDTAGLQTTILRGTDEKTTTTAPDGTVTTAVEGPDPRFGMQAPFTKSLSVNTPGGLALNGTATRTATLSDPANALSLTNQTTTTTINGRNYVETYTSGNRTFTFTTPLNRQMTTGIDLLGRPVQSQVAGLLPSVFSYDNRGRLSAATSGSGAEARISSFSYNSAGFLESVTDPLGRVTGYTYDAGGRVTSKTFADGRVVGFTYDANGNLTSITPPSRPAHGFTFTAVDRPASYAPPTLGLPAEQTLYAYNLDRQLTRVTRPDGQLLNFSYDNAGRLSLLAVPGGQYAYTYSATTGHLSTVTAPGGGALTYTYDGSLRTGRAWSGAVSGSVTRTLDNFFRTASQSVNGASTINFQYDNDGLLVAAGGLTLARNAQNGLLTGTALGGVTDAIGYNGFAEATSYSAAFNATSLYAAQYTRDKLGRITQQAETIGGLTNTYAYTYDQAGRLTAVARNGVPSSTYAYDANGNRLSFGFFAPFAESIGGTYDAQDRLTQYGSTTYSYTANGELLSKTNAGQTTQYTYDVLGNLTAVALPAGTQIGYVIDAQDRRVGKRVNGALVQGFLYQDGLRPVAELDGANNLVSRFVYAGGVNVPAYMTKNGATYRIITDHLGSVRLVVDAATGAVAQRMDYDEFGVVLTDTNPGFQPFGFAGGLYDKDTGLVRFGARDYDALTGRWTAKDPILFAGGDTNLYGYVSNDPVNFVDPGGLNLLDAIWDRIKDAIKDWGKEEIKKQDRLTPQEQERQIQNEYNAAVDQIMRDYKDGPARRKKLKELECEYTAKLFLVQLGNKAGQVGNLLDSASKLSPHSVTDTVIEEEAKEVGKRGEKAKNDGQASFDDILRKWFSPKAP